jgi:hypothetical protein
MRFVWIYVCVDTKNLMMSADNIVFMSFWKILRDVSQ